MWVHNSGQTRDYCGITCLAFNAENRPNNGPPPQCTLDECLDCDETKSGPLFAKVAARTRRRSGLISKIARSCQDILFVDHQNPCDVVQGITQEFQQGDICQQKEKVKEPNCVSVETNLGLSSYEAPSNGKFFDFGLPSLPDDSIYSTVYGKCKRYNTRNAQIGFWHDVASDVLGGAYAVAKFSGMAANVIGTLMWLFLWVACCVAYPKNFWLVCTGLFALCGILKFVTLSFLASDVCPAGGCALGYAAYCAIAAGILWFVTAGLCWKTASEDMANAYTPVSFDIVITEYAQPDGTVMTEKVTTRSNGTSIIERTTIINRRNDETQTSIGVHTGIISSDNFPRAMTSKAVDIEDVSAPVDTGDSSEDVENDVKKNS